MDTIRVQADDLTFDISRGADDRVYLIIEGTGVFGEAILSESKAIDLANAFMQAARVST